ncbi:hypothetical protein ACWGCC_03790 [Streptomyces nigrescens]
MSTSPHIVIGRHPEIGYVAVNTFNALVTDHVLQGLGFQPVPGTSLYALTEPQRDGDRRASEAITLLRNAKYIVDADMSLDPSPPPRDPRLDYMQRPTRTQSATTSTASLAQSERREPGPAERTTSLARAAVARSPHDTQLHLTPIKGGATAPSPASSSPRPPGPGNPPARAAAAAPRSPRWALWGPRPTKQQGIPPKPKHPPQWGPRPQPRR